MAGNGVEFAKKVGLVAGAALAVVSLGNTLGGFAVRQIVVPAMRQVMAEEREARARADTELAAAITQLSSDRLVLLAILEYPVGRERAEAVRRVRVEWTTPKRGD